MIILIHDDKPKTSARCALITTTLTWQAMCKEAFNIHFYISYHTKVTINPS